MFIAVSQTCLENKLREYDGQLKNFSVARDEESIRFVGNGYIGVGEDGELRAARGNSLINSVLTGFVSI